MMELIYRVCILYFQERIAIRKQELEEQRELEKERREQIRENEEQVAR